MARTNSSFALSMAKIVNKKKKLFLVVGTGMAHLTNEECNSYTVRYGYDIVALAPDHQIEWIAASTETLICRVTHSLNLPNHCMN